MVRRGTPRLTREDWIEASMQILLERGVGGVKVTLIAERLNVTSGSFYWHFKGVQDLLDCLLDHWEVELTDKIIERAKALDETPEARILTLMTSVVEFDAAVPDHAIRVWSLVDMNARRVYERTLQKRFDFAAWMFRQAGFAGRDARARGRLMVAYLMGEPSANLKSNRRWKSIIRDEFNVLTSRPLKPASGAVTDTRSRDVRNASKGT